MDEENRWNSSDPVQVASLNSPGSSTSTSPTSVQTNNPPNPTDVGSNNTPVTTGTADAAPGSTTTKTYDSFQLMVTGCGMLTKA